MSGTSSLADRRCRAGEVAVCAVVIQSLFWRMWDKGALASSIVPTAVKGAMSGEAAQLVIDDASSLSASDTEVEMDIVCPICSARSGNLKAPSAASARGCFVQPEAHNEFTKSNIPSDRKCSCSPSNCETLFTAAPNASRSASFSRIKFWSMCNCLGCCQSDVSALAGLCCLDIRRACGAGESLRRATAARLWAFVRSALAPLACGAARRSSWLRSCSGARGAHSPGQRLGEPDARGFPAPASAIEKRSTLSQGPPAAECCLYRW
mmetsp:Transcript_9929/g.21631  ORF Transcript_9929/g.21631 Transcript_9929/m.21631 type:complete len:265 (-) Transcript_9929:849-1643(-)